MYIYRYQSQFHDQAKTECAQTLSTCIQVYAQKHMYMYTHVYIRVGGRAVYAQTHAEQMVLENETQSSPTCTCTTYMYMYMYTQKHVNMFKYMYSRRWSSVQMTC